MKKTYDEILEGMKETFFNESGKRAEDFSDVSNRLKAVASELFSLSCYNDYVLRQAFPQTANGIFLDNHAKMRGLQRKTANLASGVVKFSLSEAVLSDVSIPPNTIVSSSKNPYIQFVTTEGATILAGETSVLAPVLATKAGEEYNCKAGEVTIMVNPPQYVFSVTNEADFSGGYSNEGDEALRARLLKSYSIFQSGVNAESIADLIIEKFDYATDCFISGNSEDGIDVCIKTSDSSITTSDMDEDVLNSIPFFSLCGISFNSYIATKNLFNLTVSISVMSGYDFNTIANDLKAKIKEFCSAEKIGKNISMSKISSIISAETGVDDFEISNSKGNGDAVYCGTKEYLSLGSLVVNSFE